MSDQFQRFGQKRPPLYKIITNILKEYPSGQVFKEIIQNADDARATEVKFFIDCRDLSTLPRTLVDSSVYNKLDEFRGPALMCYNDAPFTENDWESIQNLQQSGKAKNPHKVGKFGIGFNSVYHITDLPVIISDNYCGYLEPQEQIWRGESGKAKSLKDLQSECPEALAPYDGICGFSARSTSFKGKTLFRFPLRNKPSKLSDNVCDADNIKQLLEALKGEAKYLLLFLRSVCSIEVIKVSELGKQTLFKISISSRDALNHQLQQQRLVKEVETAFTESTLGSCKQVIQGKFQFCVNIQDGLKETDHEWLVIHRVGSEDDEVLALTKEQHILPWVGTAFEISQDKNESGGRIFCFLPLPIEDRAPFNVSVNGTFAVSSNRRSLNWESHERKDDNEGKWNKYLVERCLPHCYAELVQELIKLSSVTPETVYSCWPVLSLVHSTPWEGMLSLLFQMMLYSNKIVHTSADNGQWINLQNGVFVSNDEDSLSATLREVLISIGTNLVILSTDQWNTIENYYKLPLSLITPSLVRSILKQNHLAYCYLSRCDKLDILQYCLSDGRFDDLYGLELIPLANDSFGKFEHRSFFSNNVYVCTGSIDHDLLPNLDHIMVNISHGSDYHSLIEQIATSGSTQLTVLTVSEVAKLVPQSCPERWSPSQLDKFWKWLQQSYQLKEFEGLTIVPVKNSDNQISVHRLSKQSSVVYVSHYSSSLLDSPLRTVLEAYGVKLAYQRDFPYLNHSDLITYLNQFEAGEVLDSIPLANIIAMKLTDDQSLAMQSFLATTPATSIGNNLVRINKICAMSIFSVIQDQYNRYSINKIKTREMSNKALAQGDGFFFKTDLLPKLPLIFKDGQPLLKYLTHYVDTISGIECLEKVAFVSIRNGSMPECSITEFMVSVLDTFNLRYGGKSLLSSMSSLPFVTVESGALIQPSLLFDPNDELLRQLYQGEPVFPSGVFRKYINELSLCGLRGPESVTAQMMNEIICKLRPNPYEGCCDITYSRIQAFFKFLNKYPRILDTVTKAQFYTSVKFVDDICQQANGYAILPFASTRPLNYPSCLTWKGSSSHNNSTTIFDTNQVIVLPNSINNCPTNLLDPRIIGSEVVFVEEMPSSMCQRLTNNNLAACVVKHFEHVIKNMANIDAEIENIATLTYEYLNSCAQYPVGLQSISKWVWVDSCSSFVAPDVCALNVNHSFRRSLEPFIYILPSKMKKYENLLCHFGVQKSVTEGQIVSVLECIQNRTLEINDSEAMSLVKCILEWVVEIECECDDILVPIDSQDSFPDLYPASEVSYTDNEILIEIAETLDDDYKLVHPSVSHLASRLSLTLLSDQLDITEDVFQDAGQHEPLTTRLSNILKEYTDGLTIIKELIQNADDAEATEINILYDARDHTTSRLLFKGMADGHGPALIVHNNATFTEEDFGNITKLAGATKKHKPLKIGKFGVGFCSVYHITDVPSFVSDDWLYIFDPTLSHLKDIIKNENQPGKRVKFMSKFIARTEQLAPYKNLFNFDPKKPYKGTMFRFPFRKHASQISSTIYNEVMITQLRRDLAEKGKDMLLFLSNVKKITFSSIRNGHSSTNEEIVINKEECLDDITNVKTINYYQNVEPVIDYEYYLMSTKKGQLNIEHENRPSVSSIACRLSKISSQYKVVPVDGLTFCYLPLPASAKTGIPVHVSANFAVMSNRRGISTTTESGLWNRQLMETIIPSAYCSLLLKLKSLHEQNKLVDYKFFSMFPLTSSLLIHNPWEIMISNLYNRILQESVMYSKFVKSWFKLEETKLLSQSILSLNETTSPKCVIDSIHIMKLAVTDLPLKYLSELDQYILLDQYAFCDAFMSMVTKFSDCIDLRNEIILKMFLTAASEVAANVNETSALTELLRSNACIPCSPNGVKLKLASSLVDPDSYLKDLFDVESEMFPNESFCKKPSVHHLMIEFGLLTSNLPWNIVLEYAKSISSKYQQDQVNCLKKINILIKTIAENIETEEKTNSIVKEKERIVSASQEYIDQLKSIKFLPVAVRPIDCILPWKANGIVLSSPSEMYLPHPEHVHNSYFATSKYSIKKQCCLLGSQKILYNSIPINEGGCGIIPHVVIQKLKFQCIPDFYDVLENYQCLIDTFQKKQVFTESEIENITYICRMTYEFINNELKKQTPQFGSTIVNEAEEEIRARMEAKLSEFQNKPFICYENNFITPNNVAQRWKEKGPYLYDIPSILSERKKLIEALQIKEKFSVEKLLKTIRKMKNDIETTDDERIKQILNAIVNELNTHEEVDFENIDKSGVILPSCSYVLTASEDLSFNDSPWLPVDSDCVLVHSNLKREIALKLGVKAIRCQFLDKYSTSNTMFGGTKFGQREELTQRIRNILRDYPFDGTLIKELLQNADDAKATKMCIILDKREHGKQKIPSEEWSVLQGPALLVWNNEEFTEKDLEGIQKLGLGSKRDDYESIGQFGIGFNVVYHLTDCPTLITGGKTLCVFDPHLKYAPGADVENPGRRYDNLENAFWTAMSDLKNAYFQSEPITNQPSGINRGSLFRFPLRSTHAHIKESKIIEDPITASPLTAEELERKLKRWILQIKDALVFLNHITEFSYYVVDDEGFHLYAQYKVTMDSIADKTRKDLFASLKEFKEFKKPCVFNYQLSMDCKESSHILPPPPSPPFSIRAYGHVSTICQYQTYNEQWFIQQGVGDLNKCPLSQKWRYIRQVLPKHGIAAPITAATSFQGKIFCFLPLPDTSGLPVHINGQFVLSSNRRTLWAGDNEGQDEKKEWNDSLIDAIASAYVHFLTEARNVFIKDEEYKDKKLCFSHIIRYYSLYPFSKRKGLVTKIQMEKNCNRMSELVFQKILLANSEILAVEIYNKSTEEGTNKPVSTVKVEWNCLFEQQNLFNQVYFQPECNDKNEIISLLRCIKLKITSAPNVLFNHLIAKHDDQDHDNHDDQDHDIHDDQDHDKPVIATRESVFKFYTSFYKQIFTHFLPCKVSDSPFKTVDKFHRFINYLLKMIPDSFEYDFPESPLGYPFLLTADEIVRNFDKSFITIQSRIFGIFPNSLSKFHHAKILSLDITSKYFTQASNVQFMFVNNLLCENYPHGLQEQEKFDNSGNQLAMDKLEQIWKWLTSEYSLLKLHQIKVLSSWALIPATNKHLYSTRSEIFPIVQNSYSIDQRHVQAVNVFVRFGLPVIDFSYIPDSAHGLECFPRLNNYDRVLTILYHLHKDACVFGNLSTDNNDVQYILAYLARSSFLHEETLKNQIKTLPLFKSIEGRLTSLSGKKVYLWPRNGFCKAGYSKWAPCESVVFLEYDGEWKKLTSDFNVIGTSLKETVIYLDLVLPSFHLLTSDERKLHLEYIRDHLFHSVKMEIEYQYNDGKYRTYYYDKGSYQLAVQFLNTLRILKCIEHPQTNELKTISEFSDHTIPIFEAFHDHFIFLSEKYQNELEECWKEFFHYIGLRKQVAASKFIEFCSIVEKGSHKSLREASRVLLNYLFVEGKEWSQYDLHRIADISFVTVPDLPNLSWIKVPCSPPVSIQKQSEVICLTKLNQSVLLKNASLIWTVKPVFQQPSLNSSDDFWERKALLEKLYVTSSPCPADVVQNMVNLSESGLSNFSLFSNYKSEYICTIGDSKKTSLIDIIMKSLELLQGHLKECVALLPLLKNCACIPVHAARSTISIQVVLVKPVEVVQFLGSSDVLLKPYINELPNCLSTHFDLLEKIGVASMIDLGHVQHILETLHSRFVKTIDPNQIEIIHRALTKLSELTNAENYSKKDAVKSLNPLFLPCSSGDFWSLKLSTELVFVDSSRYDSRIPKNFDFARTPYSLFQIPPSSRSRPHMQLYRTRNFELPEPSELHYASFKLNVKNLCLLLPTEIRPKSLSLCMKEKVSIECISKNTNNIIQDQLTITKKLLNDLKAILPSMVASENMSEISEQFITTFVDILENLTTVLIYGLTASIHYDGVCIGTLTSPRFVIEKGDNSRYTLYINDSENGKRSFWNELARSLLMEVALLTKNNATKFFCMIDSIKKLLKISFLSELRELGEKYNVALALTDEEEENEEYSLTPLLGKPVPDEYIALLDCNINNIFRPQEWVCYEKSTEHFVWAIVVYPLDNGETDGSEPDKYLIQITEDSDGIEVSVLDLYKITSCDEDDEPSQIQDIVPVDESNTSALVRQTRDTQQLIAMKRSVCEDLRKIWKLHDENDRLKAIKRLYLKYHPDKQSPSNRDMYDEVFKFLLRQIDRLENGLPLEDPDDLVETVVSRQSYKWSRQYDQWDTYASRRTYGFRRSSSRSGYSQGRRTTSYMYGATFDFYQYQSRPDRCKAERWLKQAHTDCYAMKVLLKEMRIEDRLIGDQSSVVCQVIFLAREAIEKSLKAGMYRLVGLNPGYLSTHQIIVHARSICSQKQDGRCLNRVQQDGKISLISIAEWVEPFYTKSRFPNAHPSSMAPVDLYSQDDAEQAAEYAVLTISFIESKCMCD